MSDEQGAVALEVTEGQPAAATEQAATPATETQAAPEVKTEDAPKTFTQAELDAIVQKEKAKAAAIAERRATRERIAALERQVLQPPQQEKPVDGLPTREQFQSDSEYVAGIIKWDRELQAKAYQAQVQQQQAKTISAKTETIYAEAEKITGFDRGAFDDLPLTPAIAAALVDSEVPAKLMHYMASNPDEIIKISQLPPARQAAAIGKLEDKIESAPKVSKAPEPIKPIGGVKGGSKEPSEMTDAEFAQWRRRQIAQRR